MKLAPIADRIAKKCARMPRVDPDALREECDYATDGDLDTLQLDLLCDMVEKRLQKLRP